MIELKVDEFNSVSGGMEVFMASAFIGFCVMEGYKRCAGTLVLEPYIQDTIIETKKDVYDIYGYWIGYDIDTYTISEPKHKSVYVF